MGNKRTSRVVRCRRNLRARFPRRRRSILIRVRGVLVWAQESISFVLCRVLFRASVKGEGDGVPKMCQWQLGLPQRHGGEILPVF